MYYMLECFGPVNEYCVEIGHFSSVDGVSWNGGRRWNAVVPKPVVIDLDPDQPGIMLPMFHRGILLFSDQMLSALRDVGVDNLDIYDAIIRDPFRDAEHLNYKAVNIVGAVICADLGRSAHVVHGLPLIDVEFDSLVIDETKTHDLLMFRLAENVSGIVVHEKVKQRLEREGIPYLTFCPPEEWLG